MQVELNKENVDSTDFMTFIVDGVKFKIVQIEKQGRNWFYTIKNVEKKTYKTLTFDYLRGIIKDL